MKFIINEDTDETEKEYSDCHTYLEFEVFNFGIDWFLDCGTWFVYFYSKNYVYRWSEAGNIFHKKGD